MSVRCAAWVYWMALAWATCLAPAAEAQIREASTEQTDVFDVSRTVYSRLAQSTTPPSSPSAEELAPGLGLSKGEIGPGGIQRWVHSGTGMQFVFVPAGSFKMGSGYSDIYHHTQVAESLARTSTPAWYTDTEQPQAEITLSAYFIGVFEVTVGEYRQFMKEYEGKDLAALRYPLLNSDLPLRPFLFEDERFDFWNERQPIVGILWQNAWAFCRAMGGRLPTESEWEKAARGTDGRIFPWGNRFDPTRANTAESLNGRTLPVGSYEGGRSPVGCYDMAGNVAEMTMDSFEETAYLHRSPIDPALLERWPPRPQRALRGGSWNAFGYLHKARTTSRERAEMYPTYDDSVSDPSQFLQFGFRVVLAPASDLFPEGWRELLGLR